MTAAARYLSFNETFTPACMGWLPAGAESAAEQAAPGKRRKPDQGEMQLVYYVGVALGTAILVDFGKQRKVLGQVVSGVLSHVPSLVSRYSLGYGRTVALFMPSEGYTFFSVADESLGRQRGFQVLGEVRNAFLECLARSACAASSIRMAFESDPRGPTSGAPSTAGLGAGQEAGEGKPGAFAAGKTWKGSASASTGETWKWSASASTGGGSGGVHVEVMEEETWVVRRPSIPRSRSASQVSGFMSEAMASKFEEIVAGCKGKVIPKPKLEAYPDAPQAYLTSKKSVDEPDLLEHDPVVPGGLSGAPGSTMSARESLMSEIADMLKEVDWPRPEEGAGEGKRKGWGGGAVEGTCEGGAHAVGPEQEEEENIPGMHLLAPGKMGDDKWFSVGGSAVWGAHAHRSTDAATPAGTGTAAVTGFGASATFVPPDRRAGDAHLLPAVELPLRPSSGIVAPVTIFDDEGDSDRDRGADRSHSRAAWRHARRRDRRSRALSAEPKTQGVIKTISMTAHEGVAQAGRGMPDGAGEEHGAPEEGAPVAGRARQRLKLLALERFGGWRGGSGGRGEAGEGGGGGGGGGWGGGGGGSLNSGAFGDRGGGRMHHQLPSFRHALSSVFHRETPAGPSRLSAAPTSLAAPLPLAHSPRTAHPTAHPATSAEAISDMPASILVPETLASVEEARPVVSPRQTSGAPQAGQSSAGGPFGPVQVQVPPRSALWRGMGGGGSAVERVGAEEGQAGAGAGMGPGAGGRPPPLQRHSSGVPSVSPQETPQSLLGPLFSPFRRSSGLGGGTEPPESPASASGSSTTSGGHPGGRPSWRTSYTAARAALTGWHEGPSLGRSGTGSRESPGPSAGTPKEGSSKGRRRNNFGL